MVTFFTFHHISISNTTHDHLSQALDYSTSQVITCPIVCCIWRGTSSGVWQRKWAWGYKWFMRPIWRVALRCFCCRMWGLFDPLPKFPRRGWHLIVVIITLQIADGIEVDFYSLKASGQKSWLSVFVTPPVELKAKASNDQKVILVHRCGSECSMIFVVSMPLPTNSNVVNLSSKLGRPERVTS